MPLDDLAASVQSKLIQRVRKLAQSAANGRYHTSRLQHSAPNEAPPRRSATDLPPKTEDLASRDLHAIQSADRRAEVCHLAKLERALFFAPIHKER
jgi:hypothetical protein